MFSVGNGYAIMRQQQSKISLHSELSWFIKSVFLNESHSQYLHHCVNVLNLLKTQRCFPAQFSVQIYKSDIIHKQAISVSQHENN